MEKKYRVIKDIDEGWEAIAVKGDILTVAKWEGVFTLMKEGKAVCDIDSEYGKEYCELIK
ncbi:hypothetical protein [Bacillus altitudinis]|uniref:hypothetical protein n=1 Tax=Bacillus altitudinis TaxID=293387 RepID=UPI00227E57AE|nr:hypothetical protein [Bacillus altitudinis]MCY7454292.1 hypothetical protein [Bacillus altitudinis]